MSQVPQIQIPIADYCQAIERQEIGVNNDYQRSDRVWPIAARQFLIETILLGYPIPKLTLHQLTDIKTRSTKRWIVDGQQRTRAIHDFFSGQLALSYRSSNPGRRLADLEGDAQERFLGYILDADLIVSKPPSEVRDIFRRINSYTLPLTPEENRHAEFQGEFKWFIYRLSADFGGAFEGIGSFGDKQLVRMQDCKLLAEVAHALILGIQTTDKKALNRLYRDNDEAFPQEEAVDSWIRMAMERVVSMRQLYGSNLVKPYQLYSLLLALAHFERPVPVMAEVINPLAHGRFELDRTTNELARLDEALTDDVATGGLSSFIRASNSRTNVADQRTTRVATYYEALCRANANAI